MSKATYTYLSLDDMIYKPQIIQYGTTLKLNVPSNAKAIIFERAVIDIHNIVLLGFDMTCNGEIISYHRSNSASPVVCFPRNGLAAIKIDASLSVEIKLDIAAAKDIIKKHGKLEVIVYSAFDTDE